MQRRDAVVLIKPSAASTSAQQSCVRNGTDDVMPSAFVRNLGIYVDPDVSMRTHVAKTGWSCFAVLRYLRSIRRSVRVKTSFADQSLVRQQSVLNVAARLISMSRKFDHVTPLLRELHGLRFPERMTTSEQCWSSSTSMVCHASLSRLRISLCS